MKILLVDDHTLFREGIAGLIRGQPDLEVAGQAASVQEAIELARDLKPNLILMDFGLPDGTGLEATQAILAERPETNIIFLTIHEEDDRLFAAIRSGAKGYLLKNVTVTDLLAALRGIEQGEAAISPVLTSRLMHEFARQAPQGGLPRRDKLNQLTLREVEVFEELATGATNQEIAERLFITENTVKNHVRNILGKLNLKNRREAASLIHV